MSIYLHIHLFIHYIVHSTYIHTHAIQILVKLTYNELCVCIFFLSTLFWLFFLGWLQLHNQLLLCMHSVHTHSMCVHWSLRSPLIQIYVSVFRWVSYVEYMAFCHFQPTVKYEMVTTTTRHKNDVFKLDWFDHMIKEMGVFNMWFHLKAYDDHVVWEFRFCFSFFFFSVLRCCFCILHSKSTVNTDGMMMWQKSQYL